MTLETFSVKLLPGLKTIRDLSSIVFCDVCDRKKPLKVGIPLKVEGSIQSDVIHVEDSLLQKPREVCITEDTESFDLGWFENTKLNRVKNDTRSLLQVDVRDWDSLVRLHR